MVIKIERRTLDDADHLLDVAANQNKNGRKIEIPQDRWLKGIGLVLEMQYDTGAAAPVLQEDNPMDIIKNVAIVLNGKRVRDIPFSLLHYKNIFDYYGVVPSRQKTTTTVSQNNLKAIAVAKFDFCTEPSFPNAHPQALDALVPAHELNSCAIAVDIGAVSDIASNTTLDSCTLYPWIEEVSMEDSDVEKLYGKNREGLKFIMESVSEKQITGAQNNYQFKMDLPTGNILRRTMIKAVDNGVRSDTIVSAFRTKVSAKGIEDQWNWRAAQEDDRIGLGLGHLVNMSEIEASSGSAIVQTIKGLVMNDYKDLGYLDLVGLKNGTAKLEFNVRAPTGTSKIVAVHEEFTDLVTALKSVK